jgi:hypothetical protein
MHVFLVYTYYYLGGDLGFVKPKTYMNPKLGIKVNIYLRREKSQYIPIFKSDNYQIL